MRRNVISSLRNRLAAWFTLRGALLLIACFAGAALAATIMDAALDLSEGARASTIWILLAIALVVIGITILTIRKLDDVRLARKLEGVFPAAGNRLTNAVQLARQQGVTPVEEFLRSEAMALGRETARELKTWPVARRAIVISGVAALSVLLAWMTFVVGFPEILQAVLPRFLDPHGDHPPYSELRIQVTPHQAQVLYGGQLEVRATTTGRPVDKLWLVSQTGTNVTRAMMFLAPDRTFFQTLANLRQPAGYYVTDGRARSRRFPVTIRNTPQITLVEVTTTFPEYTGKGTRTAKLPEEAQSVPADTRIGFRVASNRPLKSGALLITPVLGGKTNVIALEPETQNTIVSGAFTLIEPVAFAIAVRDIEGLDSAESKRGRFNLLPDDRPRLHVLQPGRNAVATPFIRVPVHVQAEDDYGIERVVWLRGHNRSVERPFNMKLDLKGGPQSVEAAGAFELDKLGVRPGDVIDYYFEAADNYPRGPNVSLSRIYRLEVISKEQYEQILRMAAARKALFEPYFKTGAWLRRMSERARSLASKSGSQSEQQRAEAEQLAQDLQKYEGELSKLLEAATMFDVEQSFRESLVAQHTQMRNAQARLQGALKEGKPQDFAEVARQLDELSQREENEIGEPARHIAAVAQLIAKADQFVKLAQQQSMIAQLLSRFAQKAELSRSEQMEVQELTHQQRRVQEGLQDLLSSLPELMAKVPAEPQYDPLKADVQSFINAIAEAKIAQDLGLAVAALTEPDAMTGHGLAQRAAEKMNALIGKCEGMPQQGEQCLRFKPSIAQRLGGTLGQILAAMGAAAGQGQGGRDGYGLFNDDVALYGPNVELAGEQDGRRDDSPGSGRSGRFSQVPGDARDLAAPNAEAPGRVRLQPDAKFPLRYREVVGEYFRAIAESPSDSGGKQ